MTPLARLIDRLERWTGLDLQRGSSHVALERYLHLKLPAGDPAALGRYVEDLTSPHHPEALRLVDAVTVCHSSFYRDAEQLACVEEVLQAEPSRPARVWIPACATGEDAYSIALIAERMGRPVSILATDINSRALEHAAAGVYGAWAVRDLPPEMALPRRADGRYEVPERLRRQISFARHNLIDVVPSSAEGWDVIVCRNVLMYLARERVPDVLQQLGAALRPGGYLFVGANDVLERPPPLLRFVRFGQRYVLWRPPVLAPLMIPPARVPAATIPLAMTAPATISPATILPNATPPAPTSPAPPDAARLALPSGSFDVEPSPGRAHALLIEGKTDAALELALAVLEVDPLSVAARLIAGIAYQLAGDAQQATAALRAALVLAPDLWPAEMYLGFALFGIGDETGASRALRRGAELAATTERLPLPPSVATWFEAWRGDAIAMARHARAGTSNG